MRTYSYSHDLTELERNASRIWEESALPGLEEFTHIRCLSPLFDREWAANGELDRAANFLAAWSSSRPLPGIEARVVKLAGRTPTLVVDVPASDPGRQRNVALLYGHLDKQPPLEPWDEGLAPFMPVRRQERLYGRGTADDGYALFACLAAVEALRLAGGSHGRCLVLIESSEESGSPDLAAYLEQLSGLIGTAELVVCLDAGGLSYDRLWVTTSLRGNIIATLRVDVMDEGIHSGLAGGTVPSSFRILRQLLERVEDAVSGSMLVAEMWSDPPPERQQELDDLARKLARPDDGREGGGAISPLSFPTVPGLRGMAGSTSDELLRRAWQPALEVTGIDGIPPVDLAGNVLRPYTTVKLSFRLSPGADAQRAVETVSALLLDEPPYGARVSVEWNQPANGWCTKTAPSWLAGALQQASLEFYGNEVVNAGQGGSIPFVPILSRMLPHADFLVTGVLGPGSNEHGPNESLHIPAAKALTASIAHVLGSRPTT